MLDETIRVQHSRRAAGEGDRSRLSAHPAGALRHAASHLLFAPTFRDAGPVANGDATILIDATVIMLAIVVPTLAMAFFFAWRYRASNARATYLPHWSFSGRIEAVVWSIPTLTIIFLGGLIWTGSRDLDPFRPIPSSTPPLQVQVVALDWKWLFLYPDQGIATVNELVLPAGRPVTFSITSASVFNAFFVPGLGSMIYAMPGMVSKLNLKANDPTRLWGLSTQFSGDGFSDMQFAVRSVPDADFTQWVNGLRGQGGRLDRDAYEKLLVPSAQHPPTTFGSVDAGLFQAIATQDIPPGPGPQPQTAASSGREKAPGLPPSQKGD